jgi:hypothetical protein
VFLKDEGSGSSHSEGVEAATQPGGEPSSQCAECRNLLPASGGRDQDGGKHLESMWIAFDRPQVTHEANLLHPSVADREQPDLRPAPNWGARTCAPLGC